MRRRRPAVESIPLLSVVGPVEPSLLGEFVGHYRRLGIRRFLVAFHFPEDVPASAQEELLRVYRGLVGEPALVSSGPWHEATNLELREELRRRAGEGWHLLTDGDELQSYAEPIAGVVQKAILAGDLVVEGLLLDRVAADGRLCSWSPEVGLDRTYELGGFFTFQVLGGDPRKVVLAHSSVPVTMGNHISPGRRSSTGLLVPVHHFKWRDGLVPYLELRSAMFGSGAWREETPHLRNEGERLFAYLAANGGRIDVTDPALGLRRVSLDALPPLWETESRLVMEYRTALQPAPAEGVARAAAGGA
jgi:hypothetical protein